MAKHLRINGMVQGVGYRASFAARAQALKLSGWVRNRADGSVEASIRGESAAIVGMVDWAWHGPASAQVRDIVISEINDALVLSGSFEILPTI